MVYDGLNSTSVKPIAVESFSNALHAAPSTNMCHLLTYVSEKKETLNPNLADRGRD